MLEEVGVDYEVRLLRFERGEHKAPEFLALNPMGKVPTLEHGDVVVTEAAAICAYLADRFPKAGLAPPVNDPARAPYYRWLFFGAGCVEPALVDRMFDRPDVPRKGSLGYGSYDDTLNALEQALADGPFLLGGRFSAADVYVGSQLDWGFLVEAIEPRPSFKAYTERVLNRPAAKRSDEKDDALAAQLDPGADH